MTSSSDRKTGSGFEDKTAACPICRKRRSGEYAPFCSKRCADIDLHRWLTEGYAIPATEDDPESGDEAEQS